MELKTYILFTMIIIVIILTYHATYFKKKKELFDAQNNIIKPDNKNIDDLDIKQLKNLINNQTELINKQNTMINKYIDKIEFDKIKFSSNIRKPDENIEDYFKKIREENDIIVNSSLIKEEIDSENMLDNYKKNMEVVKTYLEDPIMRGSNIYESEQYSKLLDIGNIKIDEAITPPNPMKWSININKK